MSFNQYWLALQEWNEGARMWEGDSIYLTTSKTENEQWAGIANALRAQQDEKIVEAQVDTLYHLDAVLDEAGITMAEFYDIAQDIQNKFPRLLKEAGEAIAEEGHNIALVLDIYKIKLPNGKTGINLAKEGKSGVGVSSGLKLSIGTNGDIKFYSDTGMAAKVGLSKVVNLKVASANYKVGIKTTMNDLSDGLQPKDLVGYQEFSGELLGFNATRTTEYKAGEDPVVKYDFKVKISLSAGMVTLNYELTDFGSITDVKPSPGANFTDLGAIGYGGSQRSIHYNATRPHYMNNRVNVNHTRYIRR